MATDPIDRINVDDVLARFVEGYLFRDLETMAAATPADPDGPGHVGYPMVMTCCAGIEFLGSLVSDEPFSRFAGKKYFGTYWRNYLHTTGPRQLVGDALYQLVRHGLAHAFMTKPWICVTKHHPPAHLTIENGMVSLDCTQLFADLRTSYVERFRPALDRQRAGDRFQERWRDWQEERAAFEEIARTIPSTPSAADIGADFQSFNVAASSSFGIAPSGTPWPVNSPAPRPSGTFRTEGP